MPNLSFNVRMFLHKFDSLSQSGADFGRIEAFLAESLEKARESEDFDSALIVAGERVNFYRRFGRYDEIDKVVEEYLDLAAPAKIENTSRQADVLLVSATALFSAGEYDKAENLYLQAEQTVEKQCGLSGKSCENSLAGNNVSGNNVSGNNVSGNNVSGNNSAERLPLIYSGLSRIYARTGRVEQAAEKLRTVLDGLEKRQEISPSDLNVLRDCAAINTELSMLFFKSSDIDPSADSAADSAAPADSALRYAERAVQICEKNGIYGDVYALALLQHAQMMQAQMMQAFSGFGAKSAYSENCAASENCDFSEDSAADSAADSADEIKTMSALETAFSKASEASFESFGAGSDCYLAAESALSLIRARLAALRSQPSR